VLCVPKSMWKKQGGFRAVRLRFFPRLRDAGSIALRSIVVETDDVKRRSQKHHGHDQRTEERHGKVSLRKLTHGMYQGASRWPVAFPVYSALQR
jgi:hypothetical protein